MDRETDLKRCGQEEIRAALGTENTVKLGDVADIIRPRTRRGTDAVAFSASPGSWQYPVDYTHLPTTAVTDCPLRKGDIVFVNPSHMILVYDEPVRELHAPALAWVIRPRDERVCAEYLYLYLQSSPMQKLFQETKTGAVPLIRREVLEDLTVILPDKAATYYRQVFYDKAFPLFVMENDTMRTAQTYAHEHTARAYVFISYSTKDSASAELVRQTLEANGIPCWMAPASIPAGGDYMATIPDAIDNCGAFLLLLSEASQQSNWVPREVSIAGEDGKPILPLQLDDAPLTGAFRLALTNCQRIAAKGRMAQALRELTERLQEILR